MIQRQLTIALETGVFGGSLAVMDGLQEIGFWEGESKVSKSEDVLYELSALLKNCGCGLSDIRQIIINSGPGSLTGLRIGKALALGLQTALGCTLYEISILDALTGLLTQKSQTIIAAVQFAKGQIGWNEYTGSEAANSAGRGEVKIAKIEEFYSFLEEREVTVVMNKKNLPTEFNLTKIDFVISEKNLASVLALAVLERRQKNNDI